MQKAVFEISTAGHFLIIVVLFVQGTSYNEHRQHSGIPRMGTGLVQPGPSHSTAYLPPASLQQNHQVKEKFIKSKILFFFLIFLVLIFYL